jgi:hypothetical protein
MSTPYWRRTICSPRLTQTLTAGWDIISNPANLVMSMVGGIDILIKIIAQHAALTLRLTYEHRLDILPGIKSKFQAFLSFIQGIAPADIKTERLQGLLIAYVAQLLQKAQIQHSSCAEIGPARFAVKHGKLIFGFEQNRNQELTYPLFRNNVCPKRYSDYHFDIKCLRMLRRFQNCAHRLPFSV